MMCGLRMMPRRASHSELGAWELPTRKDLQSFVLAFSWCSWPAVSSPRAGIHLLWYGGHDLGAVPIWMVLGGWLFCGDPGLR